jgi:hypothetical protein
MYMKGTGMYITIHTVWYITDSHITIITIITHLLHLSITTSQVILLTIRIIIMESRANLHQSHSDHRLLLIDRAMVRQDQHHIGDKK